MEEGAPKVNIVICTPGFNLTAEYVKSLLVAGAELNNRGISWSFANGYSSHVGDAREITLNGDKENSFTEQRPFKGQMDYDKLMWIDSDIAFTAKDILKLYESDKDVIAGAYLLANGEVVAYPETLQGGFTYDSVKEMTEPLKVQGAGFGFICVKKGVFEGLTRPWFQSAIMTTKVEDKDYTWTMMGEDLSWCERVRQLGYDIWFDPTVRVTHHKTMKLTWEGIQP